MVPLLRFDGATWKQSSGVQPVVVSPPQFLKARHVRWFPLGLVILVHESYVPISRSIKRVLPHRFAPSVIKWESPTAMAMSLCHYAPYIPNIYSGCKTAAQTVRKPCQRTDLTDLLKSLLVLPSDVPRLLVVFDGAPP